MAEPGDHDYVRDEEEEQEQEEREDQDDLHGNRRRRARALAGEIPLEGLLRMLAGQRVIVERGRAAGSNEELVSGLKRTGMLNSEAVHRAMLTCPRGSFVPEGYRAEAWVDSPIRVEEEDFNISAPHMHAQLLESLDICPGDRVLDVGCGCGFIAACAAVLAGKSGCVVGVDIKPTCVKLAQDNIAQLAATSSDCAVLFRTAHMSAVAVPGAARLLQVAGCNMTPRAVVCWACTPRRQVCVGAACPEERLHLLLHLLEPAGGLLLAPVDSDLRLFTRGPDGNVKHRLLSSVRFSDLEIDQPCVGALCLADCRVPRCGAQVPTDASIVLAVMQQERASAMAVGVSPPTLSTDLPHNPDTGRQAWQAGAELGLALGEPDCELLGPGWKLAAHQQLLKALIAPSFLFIGDEERCCHLPACLPSQVPEGFTLPAMQGLLLYLYTDQLPPGLEPAAVVELLHAAAYYGTPRLIELCESSLVAELLRLPLPSAAAEAPHLLCLADELGLTQLRRAAVGFIAQHYTDVQVELVAGHLAAELARLTRLLRDLEPPTGAAALPKRRSWWRVAGSGHSPRRGCRDRAGISVLWV
ncbi:protein-L-isoaspartate O-methyltransferase-domain-containing protein [Scenedesmus sp. NREL 46B-D3]|nr:protein-L-isoaspartate O-methyltransferase-domain-containing protein [Scenedesmus sp. NREL 46B-D3]